MSDSIGHGRERAYGRVAGERDTRSNSVREKQRAQTSDCQLRASLLQALGAAKNHRKDQSSLSPQAEAVCRKSGHTCHIKHSPAVAPGGEQAAEGKAAGLWCGDSLGSFHMRLGKQTL